MERVLMRGGLWLAVALVLLAASAASVDWAFSVHMAIGCLAALIAAFASGKGFDFVGQRFPALSPQAQSTSDDDLIRWGVIATVFWGLAGFLAGLQGEIKGSRQRSGRRKSAEFKFRRAVRPVHVVKLQCIGNRVRRR